MSDKELVMRKCIDDFRHEYEHNDPTTADVITWCLEHPRDGWTILKALAGKLAGPWVRTGANETRSSINGQLCFVSHASEYSPNGEYFYGKLDSDLLGCLYGEPLHYADRKKVGSTVVDVKTKIDKALRAAGSVLVED